MQGICCRSVVSAGDDKLESPKGRDPRCMGGRAPASTVGCGLICSIIVINIIIIVHRIPSVIESVPITFVIILGRGRRARTYRSPDPE
jgi:hypothetical protein